MIRSWQLILGVAAICGLSACSGGEEATGEAPAAETAAPVEVPATEVPTEAPAAEAAPVPEGAPAEGDPGLIPSNE